MKQFNMIPELLAPGGSFAKMETAILYGADAIYVGGRQFSLRARATNFDGEELSSAVTNCHEHGVKLYVTVNIFAHNSDLVEVRDYLHFLEESGVDAVIIADPGIVMIARQVIPDIPVHLSTQANVTNKASAQFWKEHGISRVNLARELGFDELCEIRSHCPELELEVFIHGALCISYSGRCMLSNYLTGRDANKGDCAHPCRYSYKLVEEKRPGEYFPVVEDERGTYIFNSQDLCLLHQLPKLIAAGASSLKIEGRMKSMGYVGSVVRLYRTALDWIEQQMEMHVPLEQIILPQLFDEELKKIGTRGYTENFFHNPPSSQDMLYDTMREKQHFAPVGVVRDTQPLMVDIRNALEPGDTIEYLAPDSIEPVIIQVQNMIDSKGQTLTRANPGNLVELITVPTLDSAQPKSILRKYIQA